MELETQMELPMDMPKVVEALTLTHLMEMHSNNKSAVMRYLSKEKNMSTANIAKLMNVRYQFVRNVLTAPEPKRK